MTDNTNDTVIEWIQRMLSGTPVWSPPAMSNFFNAAPDELEVWVDECNVLMVNLTTSYNVTLSEALGGNFTIPPMTLMLRPIAEGFPQELTFVAPSIWTINLIRTMSLRGCA